MNKYITNSLILVGILIFIPLSAAQSKPVNWQNDSVYTGFAFAPDMDHGEGKYAIASFDEGNKQEVVSLIDNKGNVVKSKIDISLNGTNPSTPDIAWNGKTFGVFWWDSWKIYYASVDTNGNLITPPKVIYENSVHVSAVWNQKNKEYGVVFWGGDSSSNPEGARLLRVDRKGNIIGSIVALNSVVGGGYYRPRVATDGNGFGVTWDDRRTCGGACREVVFAYVNRNGEKVGNDVVLTNSGGENLDDMVWNGNEFAMVSYGNNGISLIRANKNGNLLQFSALTGNPPSNNNMRLEWDRDHYLLTTIGAPTPGNNDILLYQYDRYGNIIGNVTFVSQNSLTDYYPSNAVVRGDSIAVSWVGDLWGTSQSIMFAKGNKVKEPKNQH